MCKTTKSSLLLFAIAILAAFIVPAPAYAAGGGCQMSAGPAISPSPIVLSSAGTVTYTIQNTSPKGNGGAGDPGDCEFITVTAGDTIEAVLSCGATAAGAPPQLCPAGAVDPGVFALPAGGTVISTSTGSCAGVTFTISAADPGGATTGGHVFFTPSASFTLTSNNYVLGANCQFTFPTSVLAIPTKDAVAGGSLQTDQFGFSTGTGFTTLNALIGSASGTGSAQTTVFACSPAAVCRAANGACDVQEICTADGFCPADTFAPATTTCRASAGVCDVAESCTGTSPACPADTFQAATTICRASAGVCDVAESCTGTSAACPADVFQAATTVCRASAGVCDVAESCTGSSAACPADVFQAATTVCRPSAGVCDVAESCTGTGASCPTDVFQAATTICRASAGVCDVAESCTGTGASCPTDVFQAATTICRPPANACDVGDSCTGAAASCPTHTPQSCNPEACRTPGYWAQHAGQEKPNSTNQTSLVLAAAGGITVCGQPIIAFLGAGNTGVGHKDSPIEALCMPNAGDFRSQVVFQLTAALLNCAANNPADPTCATSPLFKDAVAFCTGTADVCAPSTDANKADQAKCVSQLDCLNNGGHIAADGTCSAGTCSDNGAACSTNDLSKCGSLTATCNTGNCHELNFSTYPDSPAGSQQACQAANKNSCDIFSTPSASCLLP